MLIRNNFKKAGEILLNSFAGTVITIVIIATVLFYTSQIFAAEKLDGTYTSRCLKNSDNKDSFLGAFYGKDIAGTTRGLVRFDGKIWTVVVFIYADQWCLKPAAKMIFSYNISSTKKGRLLGKQNSITMELADKFFLSLFQKQSVFEKKDWKLHEEVEIAGKFPNLIGLQVFPKNGTKVEKKFSFDTRSLLLDGQIEFLRKSSL